MRFLLALALLISPSVAQALAPRELIPIQAGEKVTIRADRAYILFRRIRPEGVRSYEPIFLRIPSPEEMERYDAAKREAFAKTEPRLIERRERQILQNKARIAEGKPDEPIDPVPRLETFDFPYVGIINVDRVHSGQALVEGRPESVFLVEAIPGDYVLYGAAWNMGPAMLDTCMCLGTVGFSAPAGTVTDLGYFLADQVNEVSKIPELRSESGYGDTMSAYRFLIGATVRPAGPGASMPDVLRGANVRPADLRAVGRFVERRAAMVNRLVPVPGVLAYDEGRVIDVKTGKAVLDVN
jgi:hypothetical protein